LVRSGKKGRWRASLEGEYYVLDVYIPWDRKDEFRCKIRREDSNASRRKGVGKSFGEEAYLTGFVFVVGRLVSRRLLFVVKLVGNPDMLVFKEMNGCVLCQNQLRAQHDKDQKETDPPPISLPVRH
jgi:hypothetical protein